MCRKNCGRRSRRCRRFLIPGRGWILPSGTGPENRRKLKSRSDFELIVAAVRRRLVVPPAKKCGRMPEPVPLHVVVLHLADALDPQRLPRKVLARAPAAHAA